MRSTKAVRAATAQSPFTRHVTQQWIRSSGCSYIALANSFSACHNEPLRKRARLAPPLSVLARQERSYASIFGNWLRVKKPAPTTVEERIEESLGPPEEQQLEQRKKPSRQKKQRAKSQEATAVSKKGDGGQVQPVAVYNATVSKPKRGEHRWVTEEVEEEVDDLSEDLGDMSREANPIGSHIYFYCNIMTNRVIYSLYRVLDNNRVMRQMTFMGKKSVPPAIRKDHWTPFLTASFTNHQTGLSVFHHLRELRKLHETQWDNQDELYKKSPKERGRFLQDQRANSIADLAALTKLDVVGEGEYVRLRWVNIYDAEYAESWPQNAVHGIETRGVKYVAQKVGKYVYADPAEKKKKIVKIVRRREKTYEELKAERQQKYLDKQAGKSPELASQTVGSVAAPEPSPRAQA